MTDVASHADTSPGDGRRPVRSHRARRGLRVPGATPDTATTATAGPTTSATHTGAESARARHRRAPGTAPFAVPTSTAGPSRHRAADATGGFDPDTFSSALADAPTGPIVTDPAATGTTSVVTGPGTGRHAAPDRPETPEVPEAPAPAEAPTTHVAAPTSRHPRGTGAATTVTAAATSASVTRVTGPAGTGAGAGASTATEVTTRAAHATDAPPELAAPKRRRGVPLRATIGLVGGGGVAALLALTTPGAPLPATPDEPAPVAASPAGLFAPALPSVPVAVPPSLVPVAPPAAPAAPTPEGPAPVVGALFDAAAGVFEDLFDNSADDGLVENGPKPRIVANPDDPTREAWQFSLGPGGKRSEVLPQGSGTEPVVGQEQFIRYTAQLSDDFPTDTGSWQLILQWHHTSPNGSPPMALQVTRGQLYMVSNGDDMQAIGPVSPGQRIDLTMNIVWSMDSDEGRVTVWRDGQPTGVTNWQPSDGTMSTREAYLKMGMYRDPGIRAGGSIIVTDLKIGRDAQGIGGIGPRRPAD